MATVKHLKLASGEEILGILEEGCAEYIVLKNVRALMAQHLSNGQIGIGMIPYMVGAPDAYIKFKKDVIQGEPISTTPKNLEDSYLQQVSGIAFASSIGQ